MAQMVESLSTSIGLVFNPQYHKKNQTKPTQNLHSGIKSEVSQKEPDLKTHKSFNKNIGIWSDNFYLEIAFAKMLSMMCCLIKFIQSFSTS
jgi:hypothetical protein